MHKTSWDGTLTKDLRGKGMRGGYSRYSDRRHRIGLQIVKNKKYANFVYSPNGNLIKVEPKYHHYSGEDSSAVRTYKQQIRNQIKLLEKNAKFKNKIVKHGD